MISSEHSPIAINGWTILAHDTFLDQLEALIEQVGILRDKDPVGYERKKATQRLSAINRLAFGIIAQDPERLEYRQGGTLGERHKHWFRAKFFQQHRLFFRYHATSRIIVLAWVNDEDTKPAYESSSDAYRVFRKMLQSGHPPDDWDLLVGEARTAAGRLSQVVPLTE